MRRTIAGFALMIGVWPAYPQQPDDSAFQWRPALLQSAFFLGVQHSVRPIQAKTRREFRGPFLRDYLDSASSVRTWGDGDGVMTNYVGHPMIGAVAGYIQVFNDPRGRYLGFQPQAGSYWQSRLKALAWSAVYSTQFELGPVSEASIGNVGRRPGTMGYVDLVVTPLGGFGLIVAEDYIDQRFIERWERRTSSVALRRFYRIVLNPNRALANVLRLKRPSHRDTRPVQ